MHQDSGLRLGNLASCPSPWQRTWDCMAKGQVVLVGSSIKRIKILKFFKLLNNSVGTLIVIHLNLDQRLPRESLEIRI